MNLGFQTTIATLASSEMKVKLHFWDCWAFWPRHSSLGSLGSFGTAWKREPEICLNLAGKPVPCHLAPDQWKQICNQFFFNFYHQLPILLLNLVLDRPNSEILSLKPTKVLGWTFWKLLKLMGAFWVLDVQVALEPNPWRIWSIMAINISNKGFCMMKFACYVFAVH